MSIRGVVHDAPLRGSTPPIAAQLAPGKQGSPKIAPDCGCMAVELLACLLYTSPSPRDSTSS
eukprot:3708235-Prorocentrum_lima.AAC.1